MDFKDISVPEIYKSSQDFRFFLDWFNTALTKIKYDTENLSDIYDPLRCPDNLVWALADTMGYKFDDRLPISFNRLVLLYFMSMIRNKGSNDGVTLAAEINLAQFKLLMNASGYTDENGDVHQPKNILYSRLDDTSIPVNAVYVTSNVEEGYIDIVYFSTNIPKDACIEYVRPLGMYCFQHAGVRMDTRTKVFIDSRLTNINDTLTNSGRVKMNFGPTYLIHYTRKDYASLQKMEVIADNDKQHAQPSEKRDNTMYPANEYVNVPALKKFGNPGYRTIYSLQLSNNEEVMKALIDPIFSLGQGPLDVTVEYADDYLKYPYKDKYANATPNEDSAKAYNLRYDLERENSITSNVYTDDSPKLRPETQPAVNPMMAAIGDSIALNSDNTLYTDVNKNTGEIKQVSSTDKKGKNS